MNASQSHNQSNNDDQSTLSSTLTSTQFLIESTVNTSDQTNKEEHKPVTRNLNTLTEVSNEIISIMQHQLELSGLDLDANPRKDSPGRFSIFRIQ
jgi:hypothetical protein